jgi:endonuclease/exonuclease/phosphatase family metal-dependent hydrolase
LAARDVQQADPDTFDIYDEADRTITAQTMNGANADVVCLQEVESVAALKRFRNLYLGGREHFPYVAGIDGNDPRLMNVAVLSRLPLIHVRSYQHLFDPKQEQFVFPRDCLEVDVLIPPGRVLTLYVNHLKSMFGGRAATRASRVRQCHSIRRIIERRFGKNPGDSSFIVLGDFNDYAESDAQGETGIGELIYWRQVENVIERLPDDRWRWTHHNWVEEDAYRQMDYLLLSKSLATINADVLPDIERRGLPLRAVRYAGDRFPGVGLDIPKASDHCPIVMKLRI